MSDTSIPQTYHKCCYPQNLLDAAKKNLAGNTAAYVLSIIAFVAVIIVAIVLTSIFSPVFVSIVILGGGIGLPLLFGLALGKIKGAIDTAMCSEEGSIIREKTILDATTLKSAEPIEISYLNTRINYFLKKMTDYNNESKSSFSSTMKLIRIHIRVKYLQKILANPQANIVKFEEMYLLNYKSYTADQMLQMVDGELPCYTEVAEDTEIEYLWAVAKVEAETNTLT